MVYLYLMEREGLLIPATAQLKGAWETLFLTNFSSPLSASPETRFSGCPSKSEMLIVKTVSKSLNQTGTREHAQILIQKNPTKPGAIILEAVFPILASGIFIILEFDL